MKIAFRTGLVALYMTACACSPVQRAGVDTIAGITPGTDIEYPVPETADYNLELQLKSELIDVLMQSANGVAKVQFTVWAYDELAADVSATQIAVDEFTLRPQSVSYPLRFNKEAFEMIEFRSGNEDALKYYVTLNVDTNGDGAVCDGDLRQDFSNVRPEFFSVNDTEINRAIEIHEVTGEACESQ